MAPPDRRIVWPRKTRVKASFPLAPIFPEDLARPRIGGVKDPLPVLRPATEERGPNVFQMADQAGEVQAVMNANHAHQGMINARLIGTLL